MELKEVKDTSDPAIPLLGTHLQELKAGSPTGIYVPKFTRESITLFLFFRNNLTRLGWLS